MELFSHVSRELGVHDVGLKNLTQPVHCKVVRRARRTGKPCYEYKRAGVGGLAMMGNGQIPQLAYHRLLPRLSN
jgi:hypothetical protein